MLLEGKGLFRTALNGEVAIITGAGRGISEELARALARHHHPSEMAELVAKAVTK